MGAMKSILTLFVSILALIGSRHLSLVAPFDVIVQMMVVVSFTLFFLFTVESIGE